MIHLAGAATMVKLFRLEVSGLSDDQTSYYQLPSEGELFREGIEAKRDFPQTNQAPFDPLSAFQFYALSFANGALLAIRHSNLSNAEKQAKISDVNKFMKRYQAEFNGLGLSDNTHLEPGTIQQESARFMKRLCKASKLGKEDIVQAQIMYVWQQVNHPPRSTVYETTDQDGNIFVIEQRDTPSHSPLTQAQKQELLSIRSPNEAEHSAWFRALPAWAQTYLRASDIVPASLDGDWSRYEKWRPTTLRTIPGEVNAFTHELIISKKDPVTGALTKVSHVTSRRQGVSDSFEMPYEDHARSAKENLAQMLDEALDDAKVDAGFQAAWGVVRPEGMVLPVLLGGLLTPISQANWWGTGLSKIGGRFVQTGLAFEAAILKGLAKIGLSKSVGHSGNNDTAHMAHERAAIAVYQDTHANVRLGSRQRFKLFDLNVPINQFAAAQRVDRGFTEYARAFAAQLPILLDFPVDPNEPHNTRLDPNDPRNKRLQQLLNAIKALELTDAMSSLKGRNKNLYIAAMYDVITQLMGGISVGHCKSSKDRKGIEIIMADAMLLHYHIHGEFPAYNAQPGSAARKQFVDIFAKHYNSGHQLLIAHDNAPGALGIRNEGKFLDEDIKRTLGSSYTQATELAQLNKPKKANIKRVRSQWGKRLFVGTLTVTALWITAAVITTVVTGGWGGLFWGAALLAKLILAAGATGTVATTAAIATPAVAVGIVSITENKLAKKNIAKKQSFKYAVSKRGPSARRRGDINTSSPDIERALLSSRSSPSPSSPLASSFIFPLARGTAETARLLPPPATDVPMLDPTQDRGGGVGFGLYSAAPIGSEDLIDAIAGLDPADAANLEAGMGSDYTEIQGSGSGSGSGDNVDRSSSARFSESQLPLLYERFTPRTRRRIIAHADAVADEITSEESPTYNGWHAASERVHASSMRSGCDIL